MPFLMSLTNHANHACFCRNQASVTWLRDYCFNHREMAVPFIISTKNWFIPSL